MSVVSGNIPSPLRVALKGTCPRCGKGKLFHGFMRFVSTCSDCGLPIAAQDSGDGPVFFAITFVGFLSVGLSGYIELAYEPAWWVHVVTFVPVTCLMVLASMRFFKAWLIALQYRHKPETFTDPGN